MSHAYINKIEYSVNQCSDRERILLLIVGFVFIFLLWDQVFYENNALSRKRNVSKLSEVKNSLTLSQLQLDQLLNQIKQDPAKDLREKKESLQAEMAAINKKIEGLMDSLVSSTDMADLLRTMFQGTTGLQLISMHNEAAKPLSINKDQNIGLYRHELIFQFVGDFFNTLAYLHLLENIPKKIIWENLEYVVADYPSAKITLTVMTISRETGLVGM